MMMMIFLIILLSGSNLGELLPWNKKMYNPKVTWKLKKRDINVVDWVSGDAVTRSDCLPDSHHLQGFCWFVSFVFEFFHEVSFVFEFFHEN